MAYCVPIKDLKDTAAFSRLVKKTEHPIFITKNGREEFVVMSTDVYHQEISNSIGRTTKESNKTKVASPKPKKPTAEVTEKKVVDSDKTEVKKTEKQMSDEPKDKSAVDEEQDETMTSVDEVAKMKEALAFLEEVKKHFG